MIISYSFIYLHLHKQTIQQSVTAGATRAVATGASLSTLLALSALTAPAARADSETQPKKTKKPKVLETPDLGIKYIEITKGSGPFPNPGDFVIISYTAFLSNGTVFDSTEVKGRKPLSFRFGQKQIISGLESVVGEMQPGGQTTCNIPAKYAYGSKGVCIEKDGDKTCLVPPNEDLKYAVKLISLGAGYN